MLEFGRCEGRSLGKWALQIVGVTACTVLLRTYTTLVGRPHRHKNRSSVAAGTVLYGRYLGLP